MPSYRIYDLVIASDLALSEAPRADASPSLTIRRGTIPDTVSAWFDIWPHSDGRSWVRARRTAAGYQVRHGDRAAFDIDRARRVIVYDASDCEPALLRHLLIDQVVPLMLSLDALVLHASGVVAGGATVAFVGPGGAGKSTLALALARAGCQMASDDGLLLRDADGTNPVPAYPGVRLWADSAAALGADAGPSIAGATANKSCYLAPAVFAGALPPLTAIHVIDPRPAFAVTCELLSGADAVIEIVRQTYRLALDDGAALARQLDAIVALTRRIPVWRLAFPRALGEVTALASAVATRIAGVAEGRA